MPWKEKFAFFFSPRKLHSATQLSRARNTIYCLALGMIAIPLFFISFYIVNDMTDAYIVLLSIIPLSISFYLVYKAGKQALAANLIILTIYLLFLHLANHHGGLFAPSSYWIILIPLLAIILLGMRASILWSLLSVVTLLACYYFQSYFIVDHFISDLLLLQLFSIVLLFFVIFFIMTIFEFEKNNLFDKLNKALTGQSLTILYIIEDLKERKKIEKNLQYLAHYDHLTGLPNRILYEVMLNKTIVDAKRKHSRIFLLYLDIDNFKNINNTLGHPVGDIYLKEIATCFKKYLNAHDVVCRLGGDEFIFVCNSLEKNKDVIKLAQNIIRAIQVPIKINRYQVASTCSIGIAYYPDHGDNCITLTKNADIAMYHAKMNGKSTLTFYDEALNTQLEAQVKIENHLRNALENKEFHIDFQPQFTADHKKIISIEALMRWVHPTLGQVSPEIFIPMAEKIGIITVLGEWVLREACRHFKQWQENNLVDPDTRIAINLSIIQIEQANFLEDVSHILKSIKIDPHHVELELTESIITKSSDTMLDILKNLESLGISIAMDDFGTGYSSFNRLRTYPLHIIKMDKSFLYGLARNNQEIIYSIISLTHSLGLKIVAEGVESKEHYDFLRKSGCDYLQGFYLCPPNDAEKTKEYLKHLRDNPKK